MIACPQCSNWELTKGRGRVERFAVDGVKHVAPSLWIAGRAMRHEGKALEAYHAAILDWVDGCNVSALMEEQERGKT